MGHKTESGKETGWPCSVQSDSSVGGQWIFTVLLPRMSAMTDKVIFVFIFQLSFLVKSLFETSSHFK